MPVHRKLCLDALTGSEYFTLSCLRAHALLLERGGSGKVLSKWLPIWDAPKSPLTIERRHCSVTAKPKAWDAAADRCTNFRPRVRDGPLYEANENRAEAREAPRHGADVGTSSTPSVAKINMNREQLSQILNPKSSMKLRTIAEKFAHQVVSKKKILSFDDVVEVIRAARLMFDTPTPDESELRELASKIISRFDPDGFGGVPRKTLPLMLRHVLSAIRDAYYPPKFRFFKSYVTHRRNEDLMTVYERMEMLGHGKFGVSYIVRDRHSGILRVCKWIDKPDAQYVSAIEIENELRCLQALDHPSIVKLIEVYEMVSQVALVYEFCGKDARTLQEVLTTSMSGQTMGEERTRRIMKQLTTGVAHCHANYVAHKDLKPENILVLHPDSGGEWRVKIIDFGLSEIFQPGKMLTKTAGSPYYMAPEVFEQSFNYKCDVWSLGIIMYVTLTGHLPFSAESPQTYAKLIKNRLISFPPHLFAGLSPACIDLLRCMLQKDAPLRPSAVDVLTHRWFHEPSQAASLTMRVRDLGQEIRRPFPTNGNLHAKRLQNQQGTFAKNNSAEAVLGEAFTSFAKKTSLKRALLNAFVFNLNLYDMPSLKSASHVFESLDANHDGMLSEVEFSEGLEAMGVSPSMVPSVIDAVDVDNTGVISFCEFLTPVVVASHENVMDYAMAVFRQIDTNGDGELSPSELRHMLLASGAELGSDKLDELIKTILVEVASPQSQNIRYEDFYRFLFDEEKQI